MNQNKTHCISNIPKLLDTLSECGVIVKANRRKLIVDADSTLVTKDILNQLSNNEEEIQRFLLSESRTIDQKNNVTHCPLTSLQSAYVVGEKHGLPLSTPAFIAHGFKIDEAAKVDKISAAFRQVINQFDALRSQVLLDSHKPRPLLADSWAVESHNITELSLEEAESFFLNTCENAQDFLPDVECGLKLHCVLFGHHECTYALVLLRLLSFDATSIGLLFSALNAALAGSVETSTPSSFNEYLLELQAFKRSQKYRNAVAYWKRSIDKVLPPPELPLANAERQLPKLSQFQRLQRTLTNTDWTALKNIAAKHQLSINAVLCQVYANSIRRWSTEKSFSLTSLVSTREIVNWDNDYKGTIGNFGSTMLLSFLDDKMSFCDEVSSLQSQLMASLPHSTVSAVELSRLLTSGASSFKGNNPFVFASGLDYSNRKGHASTITHSGWKNCFRKMHTPQVMLDHQVFEENGELICNFDYVQGVFPESLISEFVEYYFNALQFLIASPLNWKKNFTDSLKVNTRERDEVNNTTQPIDTPAHLAISQRLLEADGNTMAMIGQHSQLNYFDLTYQAHRFAEQLKQLSPFPKSLIAIWGEKKPEQYLASLSIKLADAAYLPIHAAWPSERVNQILTESQCSLLICDSEMYETALQLDTSFPVINYDEQLDAISKETIERDSIKTDSGYIDQPHDLAYVIYTSGSTGKPKGVAIPHSGLHNTVTDIIERFHVCRHDRIFAISELNFDLSAFDLFGSLYCGATLVIPPSSNVPDPAVWGSMLLEHKPTIWNSVPALIELLLDYYEEESRQYLKSLRLIMLSGDWVPLDLPERIRKLNPNIEIISLGGATEASIWSNYYPIEAPLADWKSIPYGYPLKNQYFKVLDKQLNDCPTWVAGELHIGGQGLACAYHNAPELTDQKFITHRKTGERLYKTGDLGRYQTGGILEFLGRIDNQAKLRGHRIDLLEVENCLNEVTGIKQAVCCIVNPTTSAQLYAFLVSNMPIDLEAIKTQLAEILPYYAIPDVFQQIDQIPLSANGKKDVNQLKKLASEHKPEQTVRGESSPVHLQLTEIWESVLGLKPSSSDNFFSSGGTSLSAVRLFRKIEKQFGVSLNLSDIFHLNTIDAQATRIQEKSALTSNLVPISKDDKGTNNAIVLVHPVGGQIVCYQHWLESLKGFGAVTGIQYLPQDIEHTSLDSLVEHYWQSLKIEVIGKNLFVVGWSMGGVIGSMLINKAKQEGIKIQKMIVIDSYIPNHQTQELTDDALIPQFLKDYIDGDLSIGALPEIKDLKTTFLNLKKEGCIDNAFTAETLTKYYSQYKTLYTLLSRSGTQTLAQANTTAIMATRYAEREFVGLIPITEHREFSDKSKIHYLDENHYSIISSDKTLQIIEDSIRKKEGN